MLARRQKSYARTPSPTNVPAQEEGSMRGLSFPNPNQQKRTSDRTKSSSSPTGNNTAAKMIKKLSTTLRRKPSKENSPQPLEPNLDSLAVRQTVVNVRQGMTSRAMTFAEGEGGGVPFFDGRAKADRTEVAVVKGKPPMWEEERAKSGVLREVNNRTFAGHAKSFSVGDETKKIPSVAPRPGRMGRKEGGKRWVLPLTEKANEPRLFTPPSGTAFEKITARRDRTEARALIAACSFLEAEMDRIRKEGDGAFWEESVKRLGGVLKILEERYDSIEQVYVKSHEYAVAMGRFFEVSPQVINQLAAGHRELAGGEGGRHRKSLR